MERLELSTLLENRLWPKRNKSVVQKSNKRQRTDFHFAFMGNPFSKKIGIPFKTNSWVDLDSTV